MAYTGMWLSNALYQRGQTAIHQADPAHADTTSAPGPYQALTYSAPPSDPVASMTDYPGSEWVVQTTGLQIDQTPEDHADGYGGNAYPDLVEQAARSGQVHTEDYGASKQRNHAQPGLQFAREHYSSQRFEVPVQTATNPVALQRGLNGLAENNPDGFRQGFDFVPFVDRKFEIGQRFHDAHVAEVNTAAVIKDLPVPQNPGPYNSPFSFLARSITRSPVPMIRRDPPPIDAPVVSDGSENVYAAEQQWVVG
jgi:hypothetical protein